MRKVAKQIELANCVAVFGERFFLPEPGIFIGLFSPEEMKGANFADDPVMRLKVFDLAAKKMKYIFEGDRLRIEDYGFREPEDSKLGAELYRVASGIYGKTQPKAVGFNYDTIYRFDSIIPQHDILGKFLPASMQEQVKHFGWQYTLMKDKGRSLETFFFKAVSPIEIRIHANYHFNEHEFSSSEKVQQQFERCYTAIDEAIERLAF